MKKVTKLISPFLVVGVMAACSGNDENGNNVSNSDRAEESEEGNSSVSENDSEEEQDEQNDENDSQSSENEDGQEGVEQNTDTSNENNDGEEEKAVLVIGNTELVIPLSFDLDDDVMSQVKERDVDEIDYIHPQANGNAITELDRFKEEHELQMQLIKSAYQDEFYSEETLKLFHDWEQDISTMYQEKFVNEDFEWVVDEYWIWGGHVDVVESDESDEELEVLMVSVRGNEYNKESGETRGFYHGYRFDGEQRRMILGQILHEDKREVSDSDLYQ